MYKIMKWCSIKIRFKHLAVAIAIVAFELFSFIVLGLYAMECEDKYNSVMGAFGSYASMNSVDKVFYFGYISWIIIHLIGFIYIVRIIYKRLKRSPSYPANF